MVSIFLFFSLFSNFFPAVQVLLKGNQKTLTGFLNANSRFYAFLSKHKSANIDEMLLIKYYEDFVYRLTNPATGNCVWGPGSFFNILSHAKRYLLLRYQVCFPTKILSSMLKEATKTYRPKKSQIFTAEEIQRYLEREGQDPAERQKSLMVITAFFGLARREEVFFYLIIDFFIF
jgi:hypothetical protein